MAKLKVKGTQQLSYEGIVTVSVEDNGYTLSKKTYHNEGTKILFRFLCDCLRGVYNESDRPAKLVLYTDSAQSPSGNLDWTYESAVSPFVIQEIAEVSTESTTDCSTIFHFKVPYSYLKTITGDQGICKAAICPSTTTSRDLDEDHISAKFKFISEDGSSWDPIRIPETSGNFSIILD